MTKRTLSIMAAVLAIVWSSAALAVYQETEVKVTDQGKPVPEQTVTLTVKEKDPKQPDKPPKVIREVKYKAKTNRDGKIVVKLDDKENRPGIVYDFKLSDEDGHTRTMRDITYATLTGGGLDFTNVAVVEAPRTTEPPRQPRTSRPRMAQPMQPVQPVSYIPSGWVIVIGGNVGGGQSWNRYEDFPIFDGDGFGGGGFLAARYRFASGFFIGPEIGVMGLNVNGKNPDGAFSNIRWMAFEGGQIGYSFNKPGSIPLNVYVGAGAAQAGYRVGIDTAFFHESMDLTLNGWSAHAGFEVQPAPQAVPNLWFGLDYRYSYFSGTIGVDPVSGGLHFVSATLSYQFPAAR
jgi:hypothetical protein